MLKALGVEIVCNIVIGRTMTLDDLRDKLGYSAVFIGTGAGLPQFLGIPGEDLNGVYSANEYLTRINLMKGYAFGAGVANFYELFNGVLNPKQLDGLRLLLTPFPQQQFNQTEDRRSARPSRSPVTSRSAGASPFTAPIAITSLTRMKKSASSRWSGDRATCFTR